MIKELHRRLATFADDSRGATITMFAVAFVPLLLFVGAATEYSIGLAQKARLQAALDSASVAAAVMPGVTSDADRIARAQNIFAASMALNGGNASANFTVNGSVIKATAQLSVDAIISKIMGNTIYDVGVATEVKLRGEVAAEIALVLDYSSSMNSKGKWQAMRDAAIDLVNGVSTNGTNPKVKFGLVPFAKMVRTTMSSDYIVGEVPGGTWTGCTQDRKYPYNVLDSAPSKVDDETKWGLLPTASGTCHQMEPHNLTILRLTDNIPSVINQLNAMDPFVGTHISLGLAFGWKLVSPNAPYADAVAYGTKDILKSVVLLTDGRQSTKSWGPGASLSKTNGETNLEEMCANIKAKDILLITIAFDIKDNATENRLRNCATSPTYYFDADNNQQLSSAFTKISDLLKGKLYVSK